jgi:hypothetical protein
MSIELGSTHTTFLLVKDQNDVIVANDSPYVTIRNSSGKYWNKIDWQLTEFRIYMGYIDNGVYTFSFTPAEVGILTVESISETYSITQEETVDVYSNDPTEYNVLVGGIFVFKKISANAPSIKIEDASNQFWDGLDWVAIETTVPMTQGINSIYIYAFTPQIVGDYSVTIIDGVDETPYILHATEEVEGTAPENITNESIEALDGTDCVLVDNKGMRLKGVTITFYNPLTKELVAKTSSNQSGEWSVLIKPGTYYITFDKTGYVSMGFERTVG